MNTFRPMPRIPQHPTATVDEVLSTMRRYRLTLEDLVETGGQDLRDPDSAVREQARAVMRIWRRLAALGVTYDEIDGEAYAAFRRRMIRHAP
jgi:hypothetical protein